MFNFIVFVLQFHSNSWDYVRECFQSCYIWSNCSTDTKAFEDEKGCGNCDKRGVGETFFQFSGWLCYESVHEYKWREW